MAEWRGWLDDLGVEAGAGGDLEWLGVMGGLPGRPVPRVVVTGDVVNPSDARGGGVGGGLGALGGELVGGLSEFVLGSDNPKEFLADLFRSMRAEELFELLDVLSSSGVVVARGPRAVRDLVRNVDDFAGRVVDGVRRVQYSFDPVNLAAAERMIKRFGKAAEGITPGEVVSEQAARLFPKRLRNAPMPEFREVENTVLTGIGIDRVRPRVLGGVEDYVSGGAERSAIRDELYADYESMGGVRDEYEMFDLLDRLNRQ